MASVLDKIRLTPEQESALMAAERQLIEILPILDKLAACGADCDERHQRIQHLMHIARQLRMHFGNIPVEGE